MITVELKCPDCGAVVVSEFKTQYSANRCHNKLCDECKAEHARISAAKQREKYRQTHYTDRSLHNDEINKACDRFFIKRNIKVEAPDPMPFRKEDTSRAVEYGESAARRYMKGAKDGN